MMDTHCHLSDPRLLEQIDGVMQRASDAGVKQIVTIGTHPGDWEAALEVAAKYSNVRCAIGVHPNYCHEVEFNLIPLLRGLQTNPSVVALGEMGLDNFHTDVPKDLQRKFFIAQLDLAAELNRPVVIHSRSAIDDCLDVMKSYRSLSAVFHCFTGKSDEADRIIEAGYIIGITGVVTFKNAPELRQIVARIPADQIVVETDAPWLSPEPMRKQKINEPAFVMHTATAVAAARGITLEEVDQLTTANASRLYRWELTPAR
jgi:TatD DNase family protein